MAENYIRKADCKPAFRLSWLPAAIRASINEEVVHGIPSLRRLQEGDIISMMGNHQGYYSDAAMIFLEKWN